MRPCRVRDPRFIPSDFIIAVFICHGTCAQRAKVRARVWFGQDRGWQNLPAGQFWQPVFVLFIRTTANDQFGGNFRARAQ